MATDRCGATHPTQWPLPTGLSTPNVLEPASVNHAVMGVTRVERELDKTR